MRGTRKLSYPPKEEDISPSLADAIANIESFPYPWVAVKLELCSLRPNFVRAVCKRCWNNVTVNALGTATCAACHKRVLFETSFEMKVHMNDESARIHALLQTPDVEEIIPFDPEEVLQETKKGNSVSQIIGDWLSRDPILCCIGAGKSMARGVHSTHYTILNVYPYVQVFCGVKFSERINCRVESVGQNWSPSS